MSVKHLVRTLGLALVAVLAVSAVAASGASAQSWFRCIATAGGQYSGSPCRTSQFVGAGNGTWERLYLTDMEAVKFSGSSSTTSILETEKAGLVARKVECSSNESSGEIVGPSSAKNVTIVFKGCKGPLSSTCTTTGAKSGEIVPVTMKGTLVEPNTGEGGIELEPASGTVFATFECTGALIKETLKVRGHVTGILTPTEEASTTATLKFKQTKGKQEPANTSGLETEGTGTEKFAYEPSGQSGEGSITLAEEIGAEL